VIIDVYGTPAPQGSKRAFAVRGKGGIPTGKIAVIESSHDRVKSWRQAVIDAAHEGDGSVLRNAVTVQMTFYLKRPLGHFRTGKNAGILRDSAPRRPAKMPDLSKLIRATEDALSDALVWADDALVVSIDAAKYWDDAHPPGASIIIKEAEA